MIKKELLETIYDSASMQRWNDKIRPVELRELDKQAHKMIIAYVIGKLEEEQQGFSWIEIIEGGIFEFLQRLILTDLKPQVFNEIKRDKAQYRRLNEYVVKKLENIISPIKKDFYKRFKSYFLSPKDNINKRVLDAAHFYATKWEFDIIEHINPHGFEIPQIRRRLEEDLERHYNNLSGLKQLELHVNLRNFVDLCGQLRFQQRWGNIYMVPRTSVLGHMLIVAMLGYLFSLELNASKKRGINNYFTGLFHDLPEVLTRDIISPVKRAIKGLERMIRQYEKRHMEEEVYKLLPPDWYPQFKMFTENEFKSVVTIDGNIEEKTSREIQKSYNRDKYNPRDGELIRAIDDLAAYIEIYLAIRNGIGSPRLEQAKKDLENKYRDRGFKVGGVDFSAIYADFLA